MKAVIQRVNKAKVSVKGKPVAKINKGFFVLLGIARDDNQETAQKFADKLVKLRLMADENGKMNKSLAETEAEMLIVSQFTLLANTSGGNRPSFIGAALPREAKILYDCVVDRVRSCGVKVQTGKFGEYMNIQADLDGPVTIVI
jgi:D-tyrosyl-tRNA(Tyr) deacylase